MNCYALIQLLPGNLHGDDYSKVFKATTELHRKQKAESSRRKAVCVKVHRPVDLIMRPLQRRQRFSKTGQVPHVEAMCAPVAALCLLS